MLKVLNLLIPFLTEMVFGKKEEAEKLDAKTKFKRQVFLALIILSLYGNYYTIQKLTNVSLKYVALAKEKRIMEIELISLKEMVAKENIIVELLQNCIKPATRNK